MKQWLLENWQEILAWFGGGSLAGLGGKKGIDYLKNTIDKEQTEKINSLEKRVKNTEDTLLEVKKDIETNTIFDKEFKKDFIRHKDELNLRLDKIDDRQDKILGYLLNQKK